jgi:mannose-6-phosphate isomerase-like protein (cupin superfamily)
VKGFKIDLEKATLENTDYRRVLYTAQFIRIEQGEAKSVLNGVEGILKANDAIIIPQDTVHNIMNVGSTDLKLYTVYTPPEHKDGTVQKTKADEKEEHFDGVTTE